MTTLRGRGRGIVSTRYTLSFDEFEGELERLKQHKVKKKCIALQTTPKCSSQNTSVLFVGLLTRAFKVLPLFIVRGVF